MKILKADKKGLQAAVEVLRGGGVVIFPTETSYGLAADATNSRAVARVYKIKKRSREKSLPVIVADLKMIETYVLLTPLARKLANRFFPAPLTLVVKLRSGSKLASNISSNGKIAFRVPANKFARSLASELCTPITATSANLSGKKPIFSLRTVKNLRGIDLAVDGGTLLHRKPSTIVDCTGAKPKILRKGILVNAFKFSHSVM